MSGAYFNPVSRVSTIVARWRYAVYCYDCRVVETVEVDLADPRSVSRALACSCGGGPRTVVGAPTRDWSEVRADG